MSKNDVVNITSLSPDQKKVLKKTILELSDSFTRVEAERDLQKEALTEVYNTLSVDKALVKKIAVVYHKSNFTTTVAALDEFEMAYQEIINKTI